MKNILLLLLLPFMIQAQSPTENKTTDVKDPAAEKNIALDEDPKTVAHKKLEGYRQRVLNGESMSVIATLYTEDPGSVKTGGLYMNIARGQFVPEFEAVAFNMQPGEISEIFETKYGFHFVQLVARHGDLIDVRHILVKF